MRREDLIRSIEAYHSLIVQTKLQEEMERAFRSAHTERISGDKAESFYGALKAYTIASINFTPEIKEIEKTFGLEFLHSNAIWSIFTVVKSESDKIERLQEVNTGLYWVVNYLPKFINLLRTDVSKLKQEKNQVIFKNNTVLSVLIMEVTERFSTVERFQDIFEGVNLLYKSCCIIENETNTNLTLIACDSGSDKSFDFLGAAKAMTAVKEILLTMWDRVVFYREKLISQRLTLIAESLPIIEKIGILEVEQKISPEQAELLRRNIINGVNKFISSGAVIPEITDRSLYNPRELMAPEPKLITGPIEYETNEVKKQKGRIKIKKK